VEVIVREALRYLGAPYKYGGTTASGLDCSGLVYTVFASAGFKLSRSTQELYHRLPEVKGEILPGDLLFFNTTGGVSHVGIYLGTKKFIHAASQGPKTGVIISELDEAYYRQRYLGARRILKEVTPRLYLTVANDRIGTVLEAPLVRGKDFYLELKNCLPEAVLLKARLVPKGKEKTLWGKELNWQETGQYILNIEQSGTYCLEILGLKQQLWLKVEFRVE